MKLKTAFKLYAILFAYMLASLLLAVFDVKAEPYGLESIEQYERDRTQRELRFEQEMQTRELQELRGLQDYERERARIWDDYERRHRELWGR